MDQITSNITFCFKIYDSLLKKKVICSLNLEKLVNYVNQLWKVFPDCFVCFKEFRAHM